jgi:very-short-patch-repair endonuclease
MTLSFNKISEKEKRRSLRKNMPKSEVILWSKLKNKQMQGKRFLRQYSVDQYVLDFYCPELKLAIEVDGDSHFVTGAQEYDRDRQKYIESFGIRFLRYTNADIYENVDGVCRHIREETANSTE